MNLKQKMHSQKFVFCGAGAINTMIALMMVRLFGNGANVTIITKHLPEDIHLDGSKKFVFDKSKSFCACFAAGIGCIFRPSSVLVSFFVQHSYKAFMKLARNEKLSFITTTWIVIPYDENEIPSYKDWVENFIVLSCGKKAKYLSYSFVPKDWIQYRLDKLVEAGVTIDKRSLTPAEILRLKAKKGLEGYDYTISALGLGMRTVSRQRLQGIMGVLVRVPHDAMNYPKSLGIVEGDHRYSFMDEEGEDGLATYITDRHDCVVIGGTFYPGCEDLTEEQLEEEMNIILRRAERIFGVTCDEERIIATTYCLRPSVEGKDVDNPRKDRVDPIIDIFKKQADVGGFGGQGWVTGYALAKHVIKLILQKLGFIPKDSFFKRSLAWCSAFAKRLIRS